MSKKTKFLIMVVCLIATVIAKAQDEDFSVKIVAHSCTLISGKLKVFIPKNYPMVIFKTNIEQVSLYANVGKFKSEEFKLIVDEPDRKVLARRGEKTEKDGGICQFYCEYEIRKGLPLLFIRSRLFNCDASPAKCNFLWGFKNGRNLIESTDGTVNMGPAWHPLPNARDWIYSKTDTGIGIAILYKGLGNPGRSVFTNFSARDWEKNKARAWWFLSCNKNATLGLVETGKYQEMNLIVFLTESKESIRKVFKQFYANEKVKK